MVYDMVVKTVERLVARLETRKAGHWGVDVAE